MNSPFPYDRIPSTKEFFGRDSELKLLSQTVQYSNNLLIHSKRRMGKSSLISYFLEQNRDKYLCIYVDIFDIASKEDFVLSLLKSFSNARKGNLKSVIKSLTSLFKRVRVEPSINPETMEYSIKPIVTTLSFEQMMEDFFGSLEKLSQTNQIILAIDEFQQIATIKDVKLAALLRKYIQHRENISYIFSGSKRHLLTSLFEYKAPLYELATHFELQPLKNEDFFKYATGYLPIEKDVLAYIYKKSSGETYMIQYILHLLFIDKNDKCVTLEQVDNSIREMINAKDPSYKLIFDSLSNNQKTALKIVGKYKNGFFATNILNEFNIKKQSLQSSINTLFKKELIDKEADKYFIPDRTFELWINRFV